MIIKTLDKIRKEAPALGINVSGANFDLDTGWMCTVSYILERQGPLGGPMETSRMIVRSARDWDKIKRYVRRHG
jgi:hypothetical protein